MLYHVRHATTYKYSEPVSLCQNLVHLTPRDVPGQRCWETHVAIDPMPAFVTPRTDYFGNPASFFTVQEPHRRLTLTATHAIEIFPRSRPAAQDSPAWESVRDRVAVERTPDALAAFQFVFGSRFAQPSSELREYALPSFDGDRPLLEAALDLTERIHADFTYDPRATTIATPLHEVLQRRRGVCQDFAHLQVACLRALGLPARYVSGYLCTNPPPGERRLVGADATHAWVSVYCLENGWIDLDPTNNQMVADKHILLAWGRDYDDVSPVKGVILGGGDHTMQVAVSVEPIAQPRTAPG